MPRIRTVKPEFWTSEQVMECSPLARLIFIGMWNFCDDRGVHPASVKTLKAEVLPADDITTDQIRALIGELIAQGLLQEFESEGRIWWFVTGWKHQLVNRPTPSRYPSPPRKAPLPEAAAPGIEQAIHKTEQTSPVVGFSDSLCEPSMTAHGALTEDSVSTHGALTEDSLQERKGRERKGKERKGKEQEHVCLRTPSAREDDKRPDHTTAGGEGPHDGEQAQPVRKAKERARLIPVTEWQGPSQRCFELIEAAGIPRDFAEAQIGEFRLHWEPTKEQRPGWDSTFLNRCKDQWTRLHGRRESRIYPLGNARDSPVSVMHGINDWLARDRIIDHET